MSANQLRLVDNQQPAPVQQTPAMIMPAGTIDDILTHWRMYQELKKRSARRTTFK